MIRRANASTTQGMLRRPRLNSLIRDGLEHPLLVILAGPGYGKTQAMSGYLAESAANALWLRLTKLDNLPSHFWNHVIQAFRPQYPDLSNRLNLLGFPDSLSGFDAFIQLLTTHVTEQKPFIWVFDDFGAINNEHIKRFFQTLVEVELDRLSLVLLSNELSSTDSIAFFSSRRFLILGDDLRFTRSEIEALYQMYDLPLDPDELGRIEQHTDGWALALHLLVQHGGRIPNIRLLDETTITRLFEARFFATYTKPYQLLLVRLALLNRFTRKLAIDLYDGNPVELEGLEGLEGMKNHPFLIREPGTDWLFWHHLYHLFLLKKQYLLTEADQRVSWQKAARHYADADYMLEAITCYSKCEDHARMLSAISVFARKLHNINEKDAGFFLEHIDLLTPQEMNAFPLADYLRANIYMNILEIDKAETLLVNLEKRLHDRNPADDSYILGDIYVALGFIHMMRNQEDYGAFFQKADSYLPEGSNFYGSHTLAMGNNNSFAMADNQPGARERMEQAAFNAAPFLTKVLHGSMSGMEYIISAESAFMICDFEKARQQAYRGIYKAEAHGQHDYVFNGYFVLARIGFLLGDLPEMTRQVQNIVNYTARYKIAVLEEIRDTVLAWYYLKLGDLNRVPKTIITMDYSTRALSSYGRTQIAYASYLIATKEYARLIGMLEHPRGLFLTDGIWHDRICLFILLATGHYHLGNPGEALNALWTAYDMCHQNQLTAVFIEAGDYLLPLIRLARQQKGDEFSPEWVNFIDQEIQGFVKRAESIRADYRKQNQVKTARDNPLSKRERDVLQALAQGLTREEIAHRQYISVNTVKAAIRSIYTKLAASNRAEAVSIAIAREYIEGYVPG